jgi:hypothetical protein
MRKSGRQHLPRDIEERGPVKEKERYFYKLLPNMEIKKTTATNEVEKVFVEKLKRDLNCVVWDAERSDKAKDHPHSAQGGVVPCDSDSGLWRWRSQISP